MFGRKQLNKSLWVAELPDQFGHPTLNRPTVCSVNTPSSEVTTAHSIEIYKDALCEIGGIAIVFTGSSSSFCQVALTESTATPLSFYLY